MISTLRQAVRADVHEIQRVRHAVRENRLTSSVITDQEVIDAIEQTGRGWVIESAGRIVAFAIGNAQSGNIWALFVEAGHEGHGHGQRLHDTMVPWLWSCGLKRLWLTTGQGTRAVRFYEMAGWQNRGLLASGELLYEQHAPGHAPGHDAAPPASISVAANKGEDMDKPSPAISRRAVILPPGAGRPYPMGRIAAVFKADGDETAGAYSISEWWLEPHTKGPGAHAHDEDDVFYVLDGVMSFLVNDSWLDAAKGSFVLVPGGVTHDFENRGAVPAGALNFSTPGNFEQHMPAIAEWFAEHPPGNAG